MRRINFIKKPLVATIKILIRPLMLDFKKPQLLNGIMVKLSMVKQNKKSFSLRQESIANHIMLIVMLIFCSTLFVSCGPQKHHVQLNGPIAEKPKDPPVFQEPEEFEAPLKYTWYYKGHYNAKNSEENPSPKFCPENFQVEGPCETPLDKCVRGQSLYACFPKDLEIRLQGKVLDEEGRPLRGAQIFSAYPMAGFPDTWQAESRGSGNFLVRTQNFCLPLLSASKDGYASLNNHAQDTLLTGCKVDNFVGANGLTFYLKKVTRTVKNTPVVSTALSCDLSGRVVDADGAPLAGAQVFNGKTGVVTDEEGVYRILKSESCDRFCIARKVGYRSVEKSRTRASTITSCFNAEPADMVLTSIEN